MMITLNALKEMTATVLVQHIKKVIEVIKGRVLESKADLYSKDRMFFAIE